MAELVERYVHQVGRYLPPKERAEIEAELRSQIQDQLDDRYGGAPSQAEVVAVLTELGDPRHMAASYSREQYLVGPDLYPTMMRVLRQGWLLVPAVVVGVNIVGALLSSREGTLLGLFLETLFAVAQTTLLFSAVVVLVFAVIQHEGVALKQQAKAFNPLELPEADDPGSIDRFELAFGMAFGLFVIFVLLYFISVGGLTLRFNLSDPGEVIPVSMAWMILLVITGLAQTGLQLLVLRRNRWNAALWLTDTALELLGVVCLYVVVLQPVAERILAAAPALANLPLIDRSAAIIAVSIFILMLLDKAAKLVRIWNYRGGKRLPITLQTVR